MDTIWNIPIPLAQTALLNLVSISTPGLPISSMVSFWLSLCAQGACVLKLTPWIHLWILMVYSWVTTLLMAEQPLFCLPLFFAGAILPGGQCWKDYSKIILRLSNLKCLFRMLNIILYPCWVFHYISNCYLVIQEYSYKASWVYQIMMYYILCCSGIIARN